MECSSCTCRHAVSIRCQQTTLERKIKRCLPKNVRQTVSKILKQAHHLRTMIIKTELKIFPLCQLSRSITVDHFSTKSFPIDHWKQAEGSSTHEIWWTVILPQVGRNTISNDFHPHFSERMHIYLPRTIVIRSRRTMIVKIFNGKERQETLVSSWPDKNLFWDRSWPIRKNKIWHENFERLNATISCGKVFQGSYEKPTKILISKIFKDLNMENRKNE